MNRPRRWIFMVAVMLAVGVIVAPRFARFHAYGQEEEQKQKGPWNEHESFAGRAR